LHPDDAQATASKDIPASISSRNFIAQDSRENRPRARFKQSVKPESDRER
jgi:hypothetical protein